jgi:hypothetical protein
VWQAWGFAALRPEVLRLFLIDPSPAVSIGIAARCEVLRRALTDPSP